MDEGQEPNAMTDALAIQLYRVDNPSGIWEIEDPHTQYFYRDKARALEGSKAELAGGDYAIPTGWRFTRFDKPAKS